MDEHRAIATSSVHAYQAAGMITAQCSCSIDESLDRLRIRAAATDQSIESVALDVLDGLVRLGG